MPSRHLLVAAPACAALLLTGCGSSTGSSGTTSSTAITAGDTTCDVATTQFTSGKLTFDVSNAGKDTTEVYVYGKGSGSAYDKVVGEVENIAPGTSRSFSVSVGSGDYEVACKPGQKGDGIRTTITVAAEGGSASTSTAYDREVDIEVSATAVTGFAPFAGQAGEKVEIKLENKGTETIEELELLDPSGAVLGVITDVAAGKDGEVIVTLGAAGTYSYKLERASGDQKGTFTVA